MNGLYLGIPFPKANSSISFSKLPNPPTPAAQITPILSRFKFSSLGRTPASCRASSAATIPKTENKSSFLTSFLSIKSSALKFFTSQANFVLNSVVSNLEIRPAPFLPDCRPKRYSLALLPMGVRAPIPVTTTLFIGAI